MALGRADRVYMAMGRAIGIVVLVASVAACRCNVSGVGRTGAGSGGWTPIASSGREVWTIGGATYNVDATYYLRLPDGLQFTVEHRLSSQVPLQGMSDESAYEIARPLMKHIVSNKLYERSTVREATGKALSVARIGVVLFKADGSRTEGYRVARTLSELQQ